MSNAASPADDAPPPAGSAAPPASAAEAMDMVLAGLSYLAAADPTALAAQAQAECLLAFEQAGAIATAARAWFLGAFTSGQGYCQDADYSPAAWLIHRTKVTKGAALGLLGWSRRVMAHPQVALALAEGSTVTESMARIICGWTGKLPRECRPAADDILIAAARAGARKEDLAALAAEIYARSLPEDTDDPEPAFEDRQLRVETTFAGAGVISGDLTPECAAVVTAVLESLAAPMGAEDTRTREQRYHDALEEAMRRLLAAGLLPQRAGQPVKMWGHISLAELRAMDDGSLAETEWITEMRIRWAARRAETADGSGGDGGAWLDGDTARAMACDATITPVVTGDINPGALDDLVRLCVELDRLNHAAGPRPRRPLRSRRCPAPPAAPAPRRRQPEPSRPPARPTSHPGCSRGRRSSRPSSARSPTCCPGQAGWLASCARGSLAPGWPDPACPWTSGTPRPSRPASATRSSCGTASAAGPAAATSPPPPARSTTSSTKHTAARPASPTASCSAATTTRSSSTAGAGPFSSTPTAPPPPGTPTGPRPCTATGPQAGEPTRTASAARTGPRRANRAHGLRAPRPPVA